jgi:polysaccharide export outer membrane protein
MRHKALRGLLVAAAFLFFFEEAGVSQIEMQQGNGTQNGASMGRSRPEASAAAGSMRAPGLALVPADFAQLRLAPGFLLSLNVLDDSDFTGTFRIDQQGDIEIPILGTLHIGGETAAEARAQIRGVLLDEKILNNPQVDLQVLEYSAPEVTIIGEVAAPGRYPLLVPRKLMDVLALAGGTTIAAGNEVQITRGNSDSEPVLVHYSKATNPKSVEDAIVHPGDTVQVRRAGIVYVLGAVTRPGGYVMQEDGTLNVLQAISLANGTTIAAATGTVYLLRRNLDGTEVDIALPFNKMQHGQSADVQLRATDILYVPTSKIKSILTYSQSILAAATTATIYTGAGY